MTKQGQTLAVPSESIVGEENPNLVPEVHSIHGNVAEAIVIKNGNLFFLSEPDGKVIANTDVKKTPGFTCAWCRRRPEGSRPDQRGRTQVNLAAFAKNSPDANVGHDVLAIRPVRIL